MISLRDFILSINVIKQFFWFVHFESLSTTLSCLSTRILKVYYYNSKCVVEFIEFNKTFIPPRRILCDIDRHSFTMILVLLLALQKTN